MAKRYYWLKLPEDFFRQKAIKKLRRIAGGDTYTIIYLKMLLVAIKQDGKLYYDGVEDDFIDELALDLDEEPDNVKVAVQFLMAQGLMRVDAENEYTLSECENMTGSETASAARVRAFREQKALQCNADVTERNNMKQNGNGEKEIEKEIETRDRDRDKIQEAEKKVVASAEACQPQSVRPAIDRVLTEWNTLKAYGIPSVSSISSGSKRYKSLVARLNQHSEPKIFDAIQQIRESDFLQGRNNKGWVITFDWFVAPNNFVKVLDGNYQNRAAKKQKGDNLDGIRNWYNAEPEGMGNDSSGTENDVCAEWLSGDQ